MFSITEREDVSMDMVDKMLEQEKKTNKTAPWNRLDKQEKIQKLNKYAEEYGKTLTLTITETTALKQLFLQSLERNKLTKTKEVICDKETRNIQSIPGLHFNAATRTFLLKNMDAKRVSTIKSLTPKRITEKNDEDGDGDDIANTLTEDTD
jgi:hypothetical protein